MIRIYALIVALTLVSVKTEGQPAFIFSTFLEPYKRLPAEKSIIEQAWQHPFSTTSIGVPIGQSLTAFDYSIDDPDALINSKGQMTFVEKWVRGHVIISALGTNMHGITNMQEGTVSSFLEGSFGDRIFKLEYDNAGFSIEDIPRKSYINFQIWLYERDGAIEMRYGPKDVNVGVQYKKIGIYFGDVMGIGIDSSFMLYGDQSAPEIGTGLLVSGPGLSNLPEENRVYRFVPQQRFPSGIFKTALNDPFRVGYNADTREIVLYPSENVVSVEDVRLYSMSGSLINRWQSIHSPQMRLHTDGLPAGIYILQISANNQVYSRKLSVY